ncbi:MAG: DUF4363 family protein [Clostridia bacterium]|nr:DUF4363 family protein [Clostridia bacterium]
MKVFMLAVLVFTVTVGCIWWSSWYVGKMCDGILGVLENIAELEMGDLAGFGACYGDIEKLWKKGEVWLHILVGHDAADVVEDLFVEMGLRYIEKDMLGYQVTREKLCLQIEKIREGERIAADSIL